MKMEAQGRFLDRIAEEHKNCRAANAKPSKPYSPAVSLPSLCEEPDSEVDRHEIRSAAEFRAPKKIRVEEDGVLLQNCNSESYNSHQNMFLLKGLNSPCWAHEMGYPWGVASQSPPMLPALYNPLN